MLSSWLLLPSCRAAAASIRHCRGKQRAAPFVHVHAPLLILSSVQPLFPSFSTPGRAVIFTSLQRGVHCCLSLPLQLLFLVLSLISDWSVPYHNVTFLWKALFTDCFFTDQIVFFMCLLTFVCFPEGHYQSTETWIPPVVSQMTEPVSNFKFLVKSWETIMTCLHLHFLVCFPSSCSVAGPPNSLNVSPPGGGGGLSSSRRKRRTLVAPEMNLSLDHSEGSLLSDDFLDTPDDLDINVDDIDTPDETDSLEFITNGNELEWEGKRVSMDLHDIFILTLTH